jgi:hypothetical protein
MLWEGMRLRHYEASGSGRTRLGGDRSPLELRLEENGVPGSICKSWLGSFGNLLRWERVRWDDGWRPIPHRTNDHHLFEIVSLHDNHTSDLIRAGADACDTMWLSDLMDPGGTYIYDWSPLSTTKWGWVNKMAVRLGGVRCPDTRH